MISVVLPDQKWDISTYEVGNDGALRLWALRHHLSFCWRACRFAFSKRLILSSDGVESKFGADSSVGGAATGFVGDGAGLIGLSA
jgi:hypothetical protein